jgi:hypothetical protein
MRDGVQRWDVADIVWPMGFSAVGDKLIIISSMCAAAPRACAEMARAG